MPHDHHSHAHHHAQDHGHPHGHDHPHGTGHNHAADAPLHLHSHMEEEDAATEIGMLCEQFIEGFRDATDKATFLRLAGVAFEIPGTAGGPSLKLVDVKVETAWQVGAASPAFGSRELSYLPFPGSLIRERTNCALVYVSKSERRDLDLREFMQQRRAAM